MGKSKGSMQDKFLKKTNEKALAWFEANGFIYPFEEARFLECVPNYVKTYFKSHKQKKSTNEANELGEE